MSENRVKLEFKPIFARILDTLSFCIIAMKDNTFVFMGTVGKPRVLLSQVVIATYDRVDTATHHTVG